MRKVFHFEAPRDKYRADAAVVWCFDNRFELGLRKFLKRQGILNIDPIKVAGGAKSLSSPAHEQDRDFLFEQISKSIELHGAPRVVLMLHSDCGAYGGLDGGFGADPAHERRTLKAELTRAAAAVSARFPAVEVLGYFVDFEGVWDALTEPV